MKMHRAIPKGYPVQPLKAGDNPPKKATCGHCGLSWDDGKSTGLTPVPAGRCPFEVFHVHPRSKETFDRHDRRIAERFALAVIVALRQSHPDLMAEAVAAAGGEGSEVDLDYVVAVLSAYIERD